jgi:transposase InsO family protein
MLVETDTVYIGVSGHQLYVYTLFDVFSRWAYAVPALRITAGNSLRFVDAARSVAPFSFHAIQSDHGPEFSPWFTRQIARRSMSHRHSRVRTLNDNAHLERFNRTIQEECIAWLPCKIIVWRREIPEYLRWYNEERPHMGLGMKTPTEVLRSH